MENALRGDMYHDGYNMIQEFYNCVEVKYMSVNEKSR